MSHAFGRRHALTLLSSLALLSVPGCRQTPPRGSSRRPSGATRPAKQAARLPPPLPLPAQPALLVHVEHPSQLFARFGAWLGRDNRPDLVLARAFGRQVHAELAQRLGADVAVDRPWTVAHLADRTELWYLPIQPGRAQALRERLEGLPAQGTFGARRLPAPQAPQQRGASSPGRWLVWMDPADPNTLAISTSTRGLVSAIEMPRTYGDHDVRVFGDDRLVSTLFPVDLDLTLAKVDVHGTAKRIDGEVQFKGNGDPLAGIPIAVGTLGRLVAHPHSALALTSRYAQSAQAVAQIMGQVRRQVDNLPMLVQGIGEDVARKLKAVLGQWEGRTLIGTGPNRHLRLAFGVHDSSACERQLNDLISTVDSNLEMASSFVGDLPVISRQSAKKTAAFTIHPIKLRKIKSHLPKEALPLLNSDGSLQLAYAAHPAERAMLVTIGERAVDELVGWLSAYQEGRDSHADDLLVAACAVDPARVLGVTDIHAAMRTALALDAIAGQPAATLTVQRRPGSSGFHFALTLA